MRVHIHYSDGNYALTIADSLNVPWVEIPDLEWNDYEKYLNIRRKWQARIAELESTDDYQRQKQEGWERYFRDHSQEKNT